MTKKRSNPIAENIAAGDALDMAAEAKFQLGAVEWRLLEFLLGVRKRFDLQHDERVPRRVGGFQRRQFALDRGDAAELEHAVEAECAGDCRIVVVLGIRQSGVGYLFRAAAVVGFWFEVLRLREPWGLFQR